MTDHDGEPLIPLRDALYGANGLFPSVRLRDATAVFGKIVRRKPAYSKTMIAYVRERDFNRVAASRGDERGQEIQRR